MMPTAQHIYIYSPDDLPIVIDESDGCINIIVGEDAKGVLRSTNSNLGTNNGITTLWKTLRYSAVALLGITAFMFAVYLVELLSE
jgi:hypothetical protein